MAARLGWSRTGSSKRPATSEVTARIVAELEHGATPWTKPWSATAGANTPCRDQSALLGMQRCAVDLGSPQKIWLCREDEIPQNGLFLTDVARPRYQLGGSPQLG